MNAITELRAAETASISAQERLAHLQRVQREIFAALASTLPSDIVSRGSVGDFADAYLREIAADAGLQIAAE